MSKVSIWTSGRKGKPIIEWYSELISEILETAKKEEEEILIKKEKSSQLYDLDKMTLESLPEMKILRFPEGYGWESSRYFAITENNVISVYERALKAYDSELLKVTLVHEKNIPAIENNKKIIAGIYSIMEKFGILTSWTSYEYKTSRSRTRSNIVHSAQWPSEIRRFIQTSDGYESKVRHVESLKDSAMKWRDQKIKEIRQKEEEDRKLEKVEMDRRLLAQFQVKYGLEPRADWNEVLDKIIGQNKYLRLAHYLQCNRNDWGDGSWYAEIGIGGFEIDGETDQSIFDEIQRLVDNWDGDGRCFRDCKWNYDVLYGMVGDEKLLEDYHIAKGNL